MAGSACCGSNPAHLDDGASRFDASTAHQQLLEVLRGLEKKLDGLAAAVDSRVLAERRPSDAQSRIGCASSDAAHMAVRTASEQSDPPSTMGKVHVDTLNSVTSSTPIAQASPRVIDDKRSSGTSGAPSPRPRRSSIASSVGLVGDTVWLEIRPGYDNEPSRRSSLTNSHSSASMQRWRSRHSVSSEKIEYVPPSTSCCMKWQAWNPDSWSRTFFEVTCMVMLLYDAFVTPYRMAWDIEDSHLGAFLTGFMWVTRVFWTIDLILNLFTGYRDEDAKLERRLDKAMRHYLATWFLADLILVGCDWLTTIHGEKWMRWMRVMRLVRGGRQVLRGWTLILKAKLSIQRNGLHLAMDIAVLLLIILWVNHLVCCAWYGIGQYYESDTGSTWLNGLESTNGGEYYDYLTALHWAMTQMTPGSMEVFPRSSLERIYNVMILLLGLLMGSSLVATLTSMMTQYKLRVEASSRKFMLLHQFLTQQRVDPGLALAIKLQVKARSKEKTRLKAKDVDYLNLLSNSLQDALWHSWCIQPISVHTFLNSLNLLDSFAMQSLCKGAIKVQEFPVSDLVFEEAAMGEYMYFVVCGQLRYNPGDLAPELHLSDSDPRLQLKPGAWCSEPALWTLWGHLGTLEAILTTEVLTIQGSSLQSTLTRFPIAASVLLDYCQTFHKYINEPGALKSDLSYAFDVNELVSGLSSDTRMQLATPVIQRLETSFWDTFKSGHRIEELREEVANGKCDIGLVGTEVVRNTFVVALKIYKHAVSFDRFLVKIGEVLKEDGSVVGSCLLPGVKRKTRETYITAVDRLLENDLGEISEHVQPHLVEGGHQTVLLLESPTYGIRTRYLRTTFTATLSTNARLCYLHAPTKRVKPPPPGAIAWLLRPESRRALALQQQAAALLAEHKSIVVLHCDENNRASRKLYLWLSRDEFDVLSDPSAKPIIEQWLKAVQDEPEPMSEPDVSGVQRAKSEPAQVDVAFGGRSDADADSGRDSSYVL